MVADRQWYAESTVQAMRDMLRRDHSIYGVCGIDPLRYVGQSNGVYVFATDAGDCDMVWRVTADMEYTMEQKPKATTKQLPFVAARGEG